ncbi:MAG: ATP-grasp domain-containing protein [Patescibacteria group bacterium]
MSRQTSTKKILILGSGVYRIGSSVEFDWCAVTCAQTLRRLGHQVVMINHNPETVSTDYDMAYKLYFEELNFETVRDIYFAEKADGMIISMGGQEPNNIAMRCHKAGLKILGTSALDIDQAENRYKFSKLLNKLKIDQPAWQELTNVDDAQTFAKKVGYPVLIRPSYVLSGAAMNVAFDNRALKQYLADAVQVSEEHPVVISKFIENAKEIEVDAVAQKGRLIAYIISEHIENAGIHSGDATIVTPPQKIYLETYRKIRIITRKIAKALKITGPFNIQFVARENQIKVIECNLRASRSFPFVSKTSGVNLIELATKVIMGQKIEAEKIKRKLKNFMTEAGYVGVKAPQFSFSRIKGADPILRVEMASTGEVGCLGRDVEEAFLKAILSTGFKWPKKAVMISLGGDMNKAKFLFYVKKLYQNTKLKIYATENTAKFLRKNNISCKTLYKIYEKKEPNVKTYLAGKKIDLVINMSDASEKRKVYDENTIRQTVRRVAADFSVPIITNLETARLFVRAISKYKLEDLEIKNWKKYV